MSTKVTTEQLTGTRAAARVFLSYRRDDAAGFAGRLADTLEEVFGAGSVFRDVDDIRPGEDFVQAIESHLREVGAVLVMIGPRWLTAGAGGHRRLEDPGDFVRQEIQAALASGKPLIPLLVGGATMPPEGDLPDTLAGLARRQAVVLSDESWRSDVERLVVSLRSLLPDRGGVRFKRRWFLGIAGALIGLVAIGWVIQDWRLPRSEEAGKRSLSSGQPIDITGRWTARVKYDWGDQHDEVFEFKYLGDNLHGTATYLTGRLTIEQATLKGDWITFITRSQEMLGSNAPWKEVTHRYTGQVTPEAIRFTLESGGGIPSIRRWSSPPSACQNRERTRREQRKRSGSLLPLSGDAAVCSESRSQPDFDADSVRHFGWSVCRRAPRPRRQYLSCSSAVVPPGRRAAGRDASGRVRVDVSSSGGPRTAKPPNRGPRRASPWPSP